MNKLGDEKITANEVTFILIGIMLDVSLAGLPNAVTKFAKQDGWISAGLGAIYPLYVALIVIYISSKHPKENILVLSKKYLGKVLGTILNAIFLASFLSYYPALLSLITIIMKLYVVPFLKPSIIYIFLALAGGIAASKGIKVLGKISAMTFYLVLIIIVISFFSIKDGSSLNVSPILGSGVKNILSGSIESSYDYALMELALLIYPFIDDSSKNKNAVLKTVLYTCLMYMCIVFISIYYMGVDIIGKTSWAFFSVTESIKLEVINNFRYIFVFFWIIIAIKSVAIINYICIFFIEDFIKKKSGVGTYIIISVIAIFITMKYYPERLIRSLIIGVTAKYSVIFNIIYMTLIAIIIFFKRDEKYEEK